MPTAATAKVFPQKNPRYPVPNIAWNLLRGKTMILPITGASVARTQGPILKGVFLSIIAGVVELSAAGDVPRYYVGEIRSPLGEYSKKNFIANDESGEAVVIDLLQNPLEFQITENTSVEAQSCYGVAGSVGAVSNYYFDIAVGTPSGLSDNDAFGPNTPPPNIKAAYTTYNTTAGSLRFQFTGMVQGPGNSAAPYLYLCRAIAS